MAKGKNLTNYDSNVLLTDTAYADTVYNHHGNCSKIILGAGDDTFVNIRSDYVTVNGGTGNDVIEFDQYSTDAVIKYTAGGGNDTIYGYNLTDTVKLSGGSITDTLLSDGNLVLKIGTGSITFVDAISVNINGTIINPTPTKGTKGNDNINNFFSNVTINGYGGNDTIGNGGSNVLINAGSGNNSIGNYGDDVLINAGNGNNSIANYGYDSTIITGDGKDVVHGYNSSDTIGIVGSYTTSTVGNDILIKVGKGSIRLKDAKDETLNIVSTKTLLMKGTKGNDTIKNIFNDATIRAIGGDDLIRNSYNGDNVLIDGGGGNDSIVNGANNVTILGGGGNDSIVNGANNVTILGGAGNDFIGNDFATYVSIDGGDGNDYIFNYGIGSVKFLGGTGNDSIHNDGGFDAIIDGGKGNDHIDNEDGENVLFVYNSGDGKDLVEGFNATSTLSIAGAKYTSTTSGDDLIFTVGKGKVILEGAANLSTVNIIGEEVPTLKTVTNSTPSPVTIDASIKTVDASKRTKAVQITGNKLANSIVGGSKADTLDGGGGNDTLTGGKGKDLFVYTAGKDVIIRAVRPRPLGLGI